MTDHGDRTVLNDRYEILQRIGRGGMADVLLARDLLLDRLVAIKVLFAEYATDPNFVERFRREAQSAAALNHPNIVSVYDWGKYGGTYFIAMEYVEGRTLADIVRTHGRVTAVQAAEISSEVSAALAFAHRNGVVHRDIKPANILIGSNGQVKVADFGIARAMNSTADSNLTQVGLVMGTATYFSPEQAQGAQPDPRSDLYSLGIVMYEMVAGRPPFAGDNPVSIAYKQVHENPQPLNQIVPDVPRGYEAIVAKLLAKNPAVRYADGDSLREDLRRFRNGEPVKALAGNSHVAAGAGAIAGAAVAGAAAATTVARTTAPPPPATAAVSGANATAMMPRTVGVPASTGSQPRTTIQHRQYPTGANEAVYYDPPQRRGWWGIAAFFAIVALAVGGYLLFKALNQEDKPTSFALRDVTNMPLDQATQLLLDDGLAPKNMPVEDVEAPEGVVYETNPAPQTIVSEGQEILLFFNPQDELKPVPDVTNKVLKDAKDELTAAGFTPDPNITEVEDPNVPIGSVVRQDPAPLTPEKQGTIVHLTVSQGKGKISVPNVTGQSGDAAKQLLESASFGFAVTTAEEANDSVPKGSVIRTDPAADTVVDKGSTVTMYVSSGPTQVAVPLLIGLTETRATDLLHEKGLIESVTYQDVAFNSPNDKRVISQSVPVNQKVNSSSTITIVVGRALPAPTTTPAPTTPPTSPPTTPPPTTTTTTTVSPTTTV